LEKDLEGIRGDKRREKLIKFMLIARPDPNSFLLGQFILTDA
jgi:hypothetical protein